MKMKKLKTGIAMALTVLMMGAPMIKASASELNKSETSNKSYEEYVEYINNEKAEFQAEYGIEDKFKLIYEGEYFKEEINGATGDIKITYKETGKVENGNYYEELKEQQKRYKMSDKEYDVYLKEQFKKKFGKVE